MEFEFKDGRIVLNRYLSELDEFVIDFVKILDQCGIHYVIVSGYIAIVFGRTRQTEDVDLLIEKLPYDKFQKFWIEVLKEFECINTDDPENAYKNYLQEKGSIRFYRKGLPMPNMEFKIVSNEQDSESLKNSLLLILNEKNIRISPLELQIAYKFYLGSDKDLKDAKHLINVFKNKLDMKKLRDFLKDFNIKKKIVIKYIGDIYES